MIKQTIQASGLGKKTYAMPQIKAFEVKPASIICGSTGQTEEYGQGDTSGWFSSGARNHKSMNDEYENGSTGSWSK